MLPRLLLLSSIAVAAFAQAPLSCPETLATKAGVGQGTHAFERISVFNGKQGGQEYDLAPDDEKHVAGKTVQTWKLKDYRSMNIFLRCRYHDTSEVLAMDIPASYQTCTLMFTLDKKGIFIGKSTASCR